MEFNKDISKLMYNMKRVVTKKGIIWYNYIGRVKWYDFWRQQKSVQFIEFKIRGWLFVCAYISNNWMIFDGNKPKLSEHTCAPCAM